MYSPRPGWTVRLVAVTAAAAASLAAVAGTAAATPGHRVFHGHNHEGGNWGGYVSSGDFTTATASWIEPAVTCNSSEEIVSPWVGIDGDGSSTVEQTGVDTDCYGGEPFKRVWYEMYPGDSVYYPADETPVDAGDRITATVTRSGDDYRLDISDTTKGWTKSTTQTLNAQHISAEAVIESPSGSYPSISGDIEFSGVRFDGRNLADADPQRLDADDNGRGTFSPSDIGSDGQSFSMSRH